MRISVAALLAAAALFAADFSVFTLLFLLAAMIHEVGHLVCLKACGAKIYGITVLPFGAVIRSDAEKLPYAKEAAAALAGPAAGLAAAGAALLAFLLFRDIEVADTFIDSSLILNVKSERITGRNRS